MKTWNIFTDYTALWLTPVNLKITQNNNKHNSSLFKLNSPAIYSYIDNIYWWKYTCAIIYKYIPVELCMHRVLNKYKTSL